MKQKIFNVYDSKKEAWGSLLFYPFRADADRAMTECVNATGDARNDIAKYPGDFTLFEIGEYNQITGEISLHESKVNLGLALSFLKNKE